MAMQVVLEFGLGLPEVTPSILARANFLASQDILYLLHQNDHY